MRVLVTGSSGTVGRHVVAHLTGFGHEVVPFDLDLGLDLRRGTDVEAAVRSADAVVHLAAVLGWHGEPESDFAEVNVAGTSRLLEMAATHGLRRVVFMSSIDVLGVFKGHRAPDYLPLDDDHPCYPNTPYALSKHQGEGMCADAWSASGLECVVLRPPGVWEPATYGWIAEQRRLRPSFEWDPFWEYGAFVDVRDLATAVGCALVAEYRGPAPMAVSADDLNSSGPTARELATRLHPDVPWRGDDSRFAADPYRTLLDNTRAKESLGWQPRHTWCVHRE